MDIKYKPSTELTREEEELHLSQKTKPKLQLLIPNNYTSFEHKTFNIQFKSKPTYTVTGIYQLPI